ncbi:MAG: DUF4129 domain-containing protein [Prevotella sp.]|nr:DUF4129 domain-containing protein [Prevotella sp.]MBQ9646561.1 DUF4129 domain-containing protein [Prevotella sp.]
MEYLGEVISRWLNDTLGTALDSQAVYYALLVIGGLAVGVLAWLVWWRRAGLFMRSEKAAATDYTIAEDTIYGIDFDAELAAAEARGDYRQAVRLVYLQTLRRLSDSGQIDWHPSKTPRQYEREVGQGAFSELSHQFVRVRYGNFEATASTFAEMRRLQAAVVVGKGGET